VSEALFRDPKSRAEVKAAIGELEKETSAEFLVAVRSASGSYRDADYLAGFLLSLLALVVMLYVDLEFRLLSFPVNAVVAFVAGAYASSKLPGVRRALTTSKRRRAAVREHAKAAFVDLHVAKTHHRCGLLVYVSLLERHAEVIADVGVHPAVLGDAWTRAIAAFDAALVPRPSFPRFLEALRALGPTLAHALPACDHENELPDDADETSEADAAP